MTALFITILFKLEYLLSKFNRKTIKIIHPGSVDQSIIASGQENTLFNTQTPGVIKILPKIAPKGHGTGAIISNQPPGTRVGR